MPIDIRYLHDGLGVLFHCRGMLSGKEILEANHQLIHAKEAHPRLIYALIDESDVESMDISTLQVISIVEQHKKLAKAVPPESVVAIVAPTPIGHGLARMWQALSAAKLQWTSMIFKKKPEADAWIKKTVLEKFGVDLKG